MNYLELYGNQITSIESVDFSGLSSLTQLSLWGNQISSIESSDFSGLSSLTSLDLWWNQISSIESSDFSGLSSLTQLYLNNNQISSIQSGDFSGLPNLTQLYLNGNQISSIQSGAFSGLPNLTQLSLSNSCNSNGDESIDFAGGITSTDNNNCISIANADDQYANNLAIGFSPTNHTFLAPVVMQSYSYDANQDDFLLDTIPGEVVYGSWTQITSDWSNFTGILHNPHLFPHTHIVWMSNVIAAMRFWALTQKIDFSQPVTVRIPVIGKSIGDKVSIYSSEKKSVYEGNPERMFEKNWTVTDIWWIPYVEFTTTHASRYVLSTNVDTPPPVWWGGWSLAPKDICPAQRDCSPSYYDGLCGVCTSTGTTSNGSNSCDVINSPYSPEITSAFTFAYNFGITTQCPITKASLDDKVIRSHFAKMISEFALKVLKKQPNTKLSCAFADITHESTEMKNYIKTACQLGLMGRESNGKTTQTYFTPTGTMTRAQIGTVLSRLLYGNVNNSTDSVNWYTKHLQALKTSGIMNDISPPNHEEIRWFILLMFKRAADKK